MIGPVKGGRPTPQKANKPLYRIEADIILIAVGQSIESEPFEQFGMEADRTYFQADEHLKALHGPDNVFVGGDCQVGPKTVIVAIGAGKLLHVILMTIWALTTNLIAGQPLQRLSPTTVLLAVVSTSLSVLHISASTILMQSKLK